MEINIKNRSGIILQTKDTYCNENITIRLDDNLFDNISLEDELVSGNLTGTYYNPRITSISRVFMGCKLEYIDLPELVSVPINGFQGADKLRGINIPKVESIIDQGFFNCYSLETIHLQSVSRLNSHVFGNCRNLKSVYLYKYLGLGSVFTNCYSLVKLVIYHEEKVLPLSNISCFNGCYHILGTINSNYNPDGLKDGYIYVPDKLVEQYKTATNWSELAEQIKPLSELPIEE